LIQLIKNDLKEIELLDAMCGTGKTYNLFKFIAANPEECYLYVTPMLSEVSTRPTEELAKFPETGIVFEEPTGEGFATKGDHLLALLSKGKNVICTHALYLGLGKAGVAHIARYGYTTIWDEELGMIEPLNDGILAREDRKVLIKEGVIATDSDGRVHWNNDAWGDGNSAFASVRKMAEDGSLYSTRDGTFFNVQVPIDVVSAAKRVIVATYLFEGSVLQGFLKIKGIGHRPFVFDGLALRDVAELKKALRDRVELYDCTKTTDKLLEALKIPVDDLAAKRRSSALSSTWFMGAKKDQISLLGNHIRNVARQMDASPANLMYTLPSDVAGKNGNKWIKNGKKVIKVKGYAPESCFLHKGARATNDYVHKTSAIHMYNRFANPAVTRYLAENGAEVDQENFALAEMVQWFFRTAIRVPNGPKVKLHIVSPRMAYLFNEWLNS
jgi:hypothetical protein